MHEELNMAVTIARATLVPIASGLLQSSIQIIDSNRAAMWILAGTVGVFYALYVEFGTRYMNARPFWRPPVWEAFFRIRDRAEVAMRKWGNV